MRVIDPWINVDMPEWGDPEWMVRVATDYIGSGRKALERRELPEVLDAMAEGGVEKAILDLNVDLPSRHTLSFVDARPDKFAVAARLDPRGHMTSVRRLKAAKRDWPVVMTRIVPFLFDLPPDAASYYPIYAACVELELPISINTGICGPPMPSACQDPMHLDRVCHHFPELNIVMAHGADPWWEVAIRLMIKYSGLHLMTSAYRPKYLPPQLLNFMAKRNPSKVLFSSDYPLLAMAPLIQDACELGLEPAVLDAYLYRNAARLFFGQR